MSTLYLRHVIIGKNNLYSEDFYLLFQIFTATLCPGMNVRVLRGFYMAKGLEYIDVTFIYEGTKLIGFCSAAFYKTKIERQTMFVCRGATGILPGERGGKMPVATLYHKYIKYKMRHPLRRLWLTVYAANPFVYAMMCKYTGIVYPRLNEAVPEEIQSLKTALLAQSGLTHKEVAPFVIKLHFDVELGADILHRIAERDDIYVKHYLAINPHFMEHYGVLVIIPVTWENIAKSLVRLLQKKHPYRGPDQLSGRVKPAT